RRRDTERKDSYPQITQIYADLLVPLCSLWMNLWLCLCRSGGYVRCALRRGEAGFLLQLSRNGVLPPGAACPLVSHALPLQKDRRQDDLSSPRRPVCSISPRERSTGPRRATTDPAPVAPLVCRFSVSPTGSLNAPGAVARPGVRFVRQYHSYTNTP